MSDPRNDFLFPRDSTGTRGAVKKTTDGLDFYVPTVLHGSDGKTAISAANPLPTSFLVMPNNAAFNGTGSMTKTYEQSMFSFAIKNKHTAALTFTIDGNSIEVDGGESFEATFNPFTEVVIVASGAFKAYAKTYPNFVDIIAPEPVEPDTTAPDNVTGLAVSNLAYNSLTLSWTASASSDVQSYKVYNGVTLLATVSGVNCNLTGLTPSTAYTFTVKAVDTSSNVSTGANVQATTTAIPADTTAPTNVSSVSTSNLAQTSVTLTWPASASGDVSGYDVYNGSTFITTVTGLTYGVTGLTASTQYTFWVKARDASGNVATGTGVTFTTSETADTTPPTVTISPAAGTFTSTQSVTLSGSDNSGGSVTIYYTTDGSTPTQSSTVYSSAISVAATTTIKYFGKDPSGNVSVVQTAVYTINQTDTTAPIAVTGLTAGTTTATTVPLSWTLSSSGDVTTQEVAYSTDGTNFTIASSAVNAATNSYTVTGLTASTAYTFRVVAIDAANNRSTAVTTTSTTAAVAAITDDFNRTDSSTSLGVATTGQTWNALKGTWGISGNQAYQAAVLADSLVVIESSRSDVTVQVTLPTNDKLSRLVFRAIDVNNYLYCQSHTNQAGASFSFYKVVNGTTTLINSVANTAANGDVLKAVLNGSSVTLFKNGTQMLTATVTDHQTATKHGIGQSFAATSRFDYFSIV